eukprot:COSAG04_NODE_103_length_26181_cov_19.804616_11_plen_81_part_00
MDEVRLREVKRGTGGSLRRAGRCQQAPSLVLVHGWPWQGCRWQRDALCRCAGYYLLSFSGSRRSLIMSLVGKSRKHFNFY